MALRAIYILFEIPLFFDSPCSYLALDIKYIIIIINNNKITKPPLAHRHHKDTCRVKILTGKKLFCCEKSVSFSCCWVGVTYLPSGSHRVWLVWSRSCGAPVVSSGNIYTLCNHIWHRSVQFYVIWMNVSLRWVWDIWWVNGNGVSRMCQLCHCVSYLQWPVHSVLT